MKKLTVFLLACTFLNLTGQTQGITVPRTPSPAATVGQTIGISTVTINYSRPSVKGRNVWGELVPFGWNVQTFGTGNEAPWRAGANENTVITFSHDATVEGHPVPKGSYGLFFVINKDNTGEVILSKDYRSWGSFFYDKNNDLLRAPIRLNDIPYTELLTYEFSHITKNGGELDLNWEKKQFPVKITFAVDDIVLKNAEAELRGPVGFTWMGPLSAANYALQNKVELDKALAWANQAVAQNNSFATLRVKSNILKEMGDTVQASKIMKDGLTIASENDLNQYGYQLLGQNKFDQAISILVTATQRFPTSANAWDSLGEGYALKGDRKNAIASFKKSLTLNPNPNTKANSEKYLKQLGAM
jgi:tetratricopeptide (TPR) repeat protein